MVKAGFDFQHAVFCKYVLNNGIKIEHNLRLAYT